MNDMADTFEGRRRALDESFGQLTRQTNEDPEATVTAESEDDKRHPLSDTLYLSHTAPATNDAPQQPVPERPTAEQRLYSDRILAEEKLHQAGEQAREKAADFVDDKVKPAAQQASQFKEESSEKAAQFTDDVKDRLAAFTETAQTDPARAAVEAGKAILMGIGALAVLKMIFRGR